MTQRDWESFFLKHPFFFFLAKILVRFVNGIRACIRVVKYLTRSNMVKRRATQLNLYRTNKISYFLSYWPVENELIYDRAQIASLYAENPAVFQNAWRRTKTQRVKKRPEFNQTTRLWITLNIVDVVRRDWRRCYYCWCPYTIEEFLSGKVQVEHMNPLAANGKHVPANIVMACPGCNSLKGKLTDEDMIEIYRSPEQFFSRNRYNSDKRTQLQDFVGMSVYGLIANEEFFDSRGVDPSSRTAHITKLKKEYREKYP